MARKTGKTVASLVMGALAVGNVQAAAMDGILAQDAQTTVAQQDALKQEGEDAKTVALNKAANMFGQNDQQKLRTVRLEFPAVLTDIAENKANLIQLGIQNAEYKVATDEKIEQLTTQLNDKINADNTALESKADKLAVGEALADLADLTQTELATKADKTEVAEKLDQKADKLAVGEALADLADLTQTELATKADKTEVAEKLDQKADKLAVGEALADLADLTQTELATKADKTEVAEKLDQKADKLAVGEALADLADLTQTELAKKADKKATEDALAEKADKKATEDALAEKADKKATEDALAEKADKKATEDALAEKADKKATEDALAEKADKKATEDALANKVDKEELAKITNGVVDTVQTVAENTQDIADLEAEKADKTEVVEVADRVTTVENEVEEHTEEIAILNAQNTQQDNQISHLNKRIDDLAEETENGLAAQAALTGLFQPYNVGKFNVSAAVGGYKSKTAIAIGAGYRFNEKVAAKAGIATSTRGGGAAYNVGVNFEW